MELPITKPSQVSYADELEFSDLMEKMFEKGYDGFIRITHGSEEGYILFEDGTPVAASYDRFFKNEAVQQIEKAMEKSDSLIEVFDLKPSQIGYLLDLNKTYKIEINQSQSSFAPEIESEYVDDQKDYGYDDNVFNPKEASYRQPIAKIEAEEQAEYERRNGNASAAESFSKSPAEPEILTENNSNNSETITQSDSISDSSPKQDSNQNVSVNNESNVLDESLKQPNDSELENSKIETNIETTKSETDESSITDTNSLPVSEPNLETSELAKSEPKEVNELNAEIKTESKTSTGHETITSTESDLKPEESEIESSDEIEEPKIPVDREELMKKYGLKDIQEEEVDKVLDTYKGGTVSSGDVERIELTLMNRIKQSVMGVPKIKSTEVMVFLDNTRELGGKIKIITEYEGKGLFSRIMGESKDMQNLRYQILDITEMEIRKSFREYPQIVDNFDINIEVVN